MANDTTVEKTDGKTIEQAVKCLEGYQDREADNIARAQEAILFRSGDQWPQMIRRDRENQEQEGGSRPCPVLDKTDQYVRQIVNEERLNRAAIKIRPVDDYADPKTAEIFTGIIRHIEDASEALVAYTTAGEHAIDGGFGFFRLVADYTDPMSFEQDIQIKRIHNRFSVATGAHTETDGSDMRECLVWEDVAREDFKAEYPDAKEVGFEKGDDWSDEDTLRVAEYYRIETETKTIHRMDNGEVFTDEELENIKEEAGAEDVVVPEPLESRESTFNNIKWYKVTAEEVLDSKAIPGRFIPIIKVTGNEITLPDGKIRLSGAIEASMDAQRLHNYSIAGFIEHVALAPRAPWVAEEGQIEGYEDEYAQANRKPISVLKYKNVSVDGHLLPPPQRTPPPGMSTGWQQVMQNTEHGVEAAFGMYGPSVGAQSQEKSGVALQEQKAQGAVGQFHFPDNLSRSIQHCGRILIEWIPVYKDVATIARILGEDGEQEVVQLNPKQEKSMMPNQDNMGKEIGQIYNLGVGKYDVTVTTGPSYTAKRQEAVDTQTQIISSAPDLMPIIGDILFKNMDAPGTDEISKRLETMLPPEIKALKENEAQNIDPQTAEAMQQVEQAGQMLEERGQQLMQFEQELEAKAQEAGADKAQLDASRAQLEASRKVFMADVSTQKATLELIGVKLINQLEDVTEPLEQQLAAQTTEIESYEPDENGEPQTIVVQDPAMQEILQNVAMMSQQSTAQMTQVVNDALISVSQSLNQPRQTQLQYDEAGNPISSVSTPV